jgi:hypothetical protein
MERAHESEYSVSHANRRGIADGAATETEKVCTKCFVSKPANTEFFLGSKSRAGKFRLDGSCRLCRAAAKLAWARAARLDPAKCAEMKAAARAAAAKRREDPVYRAKQNAVNKANRADPEYRAREAVSRRAYFADTANRVKLAAARKARREDPILGAADRAKREGNRARKAELDRALRQDPEWRSRKVAYQREWDAKPANRRRRNQRLVAKRKQQPHVKVQQNARSVIRSMIKQGSKGCIRHLPYTIPELCTHLEKQFVRGMTWENYGPEWHIDHILPIASFDIDAADPSNCPEFQACWALTNLRPLWKLDNLSKASIRVHLI